MEINDTLNIYYEEILNTLQGEFEYVINTYYDKYKDYKIYLSDEVQYNKTKDKDPKAIYIVIKFLQASVTFGQSVLPFSMTILGEENVMMVTQQMLTDFSELFNLQWTDSTKRIRQVFNSPSVINNFQSVYAGFRSLYRMGGVFVISDTANYYDIYYIYQVYDAEHERYVDEVEELALLNTSLAYNGNPDTQAFYQNYNFTKSEIMAGSLVINFSSFLLHGKKLNDEIVSIICNGKKMTSDGIVQSGTETNINKKFKLRILFRNDYVIEKEFRLVNLGLTQNLGELPLMSFSFSE